MMYITVFPRLTNIMYIIIFVLHYLFFIVATVATLSITRKNQEPGYNMYCILGILPGTETKFNGTRLLCVGHDNDDDVSLNNIVS